MNFEQFTYQTIQDLYNEGCSMVPKEKGIYIIIAPDAFKIKFLDKTTAMQHHRGKSLLYPVEDLKEKFYKTDLKTLYIGKAGGERNKLRQRIKQYVRYGYDEVENHRGGRAIWQIDNNKELLLGYYACENPEVEERRMLTEFYKEYGTFPVANWV